MLIFNTNEMSYIIPHDLEKGASISGYSGEITEAQKISDLTKVPQLVHHRAVS